MKDNCVYEGIGKGLLIHCRNTTVLEDSLELPAKT